MIGKTIQNIEVTALLGKGGMGTVYKGKDVMLKRDVALKVLHPELLYDDQVTKRFQSEAIMLASLNHTNITSLYNLIKVEDNFMMIMEFVDGRSLEDMLHEKKRFSEDEAIEYIKQALDGLKHAHDKNIIHRDMKLANIMVTTEGVVKVMDFGIARVLGSSRLTSSGRVIGTLEYMSPEQVRGEEGDERSDIYALGTVLYEMVAGRVPFKSTSDYDLMTTKINQKPPSIRSFVETNSALDNILSKAMNIDPKHRYQTADQFRQALVEYQKKQIAKSTKPKQKPLSAAALLKTKNILPDSKEIQGKLQKSGVSGIPGLLIEKIKNNRKIVIQVLAAVCCVVLLFGVAHKIRKTRLDSRNSGNSAVLIDSLDQQNVDNSETGQNTMIYPETPKLDPSRLPVSGGADQKDNEKSNNSEKQRSNNRVAEKNSEKTNEEPKESNSNRETKKTETKENRITEPGNKEIEKPTENKADDRKMEEDNTKEDSTGGSNLEEKVESVTEKINQTGRKLLKDFKEILTLEEDEKGKEQEQAKKEEKEKKQEPQTVFVQAYTTIYVRLSEAVSSESARKGQQVRLTIDRDVVVDGIVAIPRGHIFNGIITDVKASGGTKKGMLELNIPSINLSGTQSVPLRASTFRIMGDKDQEASFPGGQTFEVQTAQRSKIILGA